MPAPSRCGVDSALPKLSLPVRSSKTAISVNVPPISAARRRRAPFRFAAVRRVILSSGRGRVRFLTFIGLSAGPGGGGAGRGGGGRGELIFGLLPLPPHSTPPPHPPQFNP